MSGKQMVLFPCGNFLYITVIIAYATKNTKSNIAEDNLLIFYAD